MQQGIGLGLKSKLILLHISKEALELVVIMLNCDHVKLHSTKYTQCTTLSLFGCGQSLLTVFSVVVIIIQCF